MRAERTTLSRLTYDDLNRYPAWAVDPTSAEDEDRSLTSLELTDGVLVPADVGEVWCLCKARFADQTEHPASAMCRGDSADGPLLGSVWNGSENVSLFVPPAPDFVLAQDGPAAFASKFGMPLDRVFPLRIECVAQFATPPQERGVTIRADGTNAR